MQCAVEIDELLVLRLATQAQINVFTRPNWLTYGTGELRALDAPPQLIPRERASDDKSAPKVPEITSEFTKTTADVGWNCMAQDDRPVSYNILTQCICCVLSYGVFVMHCDYSGCLSFDCGVHFALNEQLLQQFIASCVHSAPLLHYVIVGEGLIFVSMALSVPKITFVMSQSRSGCNFILHLATVHPVERRFLDTGKQLSDTSRRIIIIATVITAQL